MCDDIVPGSSPSYEVAKLIYVYHPLGARMAEAPVDLAMSQKRELSIPTAPGDVLVEAFEKEWKRLQCNKTVRNVMTLSRVYGQAAVVMLVEGKATEEAITPEELAKANITFNIVDPLNTAGSLVLNQDPNAANFLKPSGVSVAGKAYHPSRSLVVMNEQPIYIEWTNSAFGFVGRSVYQRALYPLKSFLQSMLTDNQILEKSGLLVTKLKTPGSITDQRTRNFFGFKRTQIQQAKTGNVLQIGVDEEVESINLNNLKDPTEFARNNVLKNIATAAKMPAALLNQETLVQGFGEGSEDAKQIARWIDSYREEMEPVTTWLDNIVMMRAWNEDFYKTIQARFQEYKNVPYDTAFYFWKNKFEAKWPNLLEEPDSEKVKVDDVVTRAAISLADVLLPVADPINKAAIATWLADVVNSRKMMLSDPLVIDGEALAAYEPQQAEPDLATEEPPIKTDRPAVVHKMAR
jgi:hypothetical protein